LFGPNIFLTIFRSNTSSLLIMVLLISMYRMNM
jgi:hypothetical protein